MDLGSMYATLVVKSKGFKRAEKQFDKLEKRAHASTRATQRRMNTFTKNTGKTLSNFSTMAGKHINGVTGKIENMANTSAKSFNKFNSAASSGTNKFTGSMEKMATSTKRLLPVVQRNLSRVSSRMKQIGGPTIMNIDAWQKSCNRVTGSIGKMASTSAKSFNKFNSAAGIGANRFASFMSKMTKSSMSFGQIKMDLNSTSRSIRNFGKRLDANMEKLAKWGKAGAQAGEQFMRFGYYASMYLTLPIIGAGVAAVGFQKRFGAALNQLNNLMGVSKQKVESIKETILDLAPKTGQGTYELIDSFKIIMQKGFKAGQTLRILEKTAKATSASNTRSVQNMAMAVSSAMSSYGKSHLLASEATSTLLKLMGEEGIQARMLTSALGGVLRPAANLGVKFKDLGAAIAIAGDTGKNVAWVSSQLLSVFDALRNPTDKAREALQRLYKEGFVGLRKILREKGLLALLKKLNNLFTNHKRVMSQVIFSGEEFNGLLDLLRNDMSVVEDQFRQFNTTLGYVEEKFQGVTHTIQFKFQRAMSETETMFVRIGETIKGPATHALDSLNKFLGEAANKFESLTQKQINNIITISKWIAIMGPAAMALGLIASILSNIAIVIGKVRIALKLLFSTLSLVIGAGTALATGIIYLIERLRGLKTWFDKSSESAKNWKEQIKGLGAVLKQTEKGLISEYKFIQQKLKSIQKMSQTQLRTTVAQIQGQINQEKRFTFNIEQELKKRLKANEKYQSVLKKLRDPTTSDEWVHIYEKERLSIKKLIAERSGMNESYEESKKRIKELEKALIKVNKLVKDFDIGSIGGIGIGDDGIKESLALWQKLQKYSDMEALLGKDNYNFASKAASAYRNELNKLTEASIRGEDVSYKYMQRLAQQALAYEKLAEVNKEVNKELNDQLTIMEKLNKQLRTNEERNKNLGNLYNKRKQDLQAYKQAFNELTAIEDPTAKQRASIEKTARAIKALTKDVKKEIFTWEDVMNAASRRIGHAVSKMAAQFGEAMVKEQNAAQMMVSIVLQTTQQFIAAMLAKAAAALVANETVQRGLFGLLFAATVGISMLNAAWQKNVSSQMDQAQGMAGGGTVPSGYPNDSYPAMLTSGEKVLPPEELDNGKLGDKLDITIHGEASGEDLKFVIDEYERKKSNTF